VARQKANEKRTLVRRPAYDNHARLELKHVLRTLRRDVEANGAQGMAQRQSGRDESSICVQLRSCATAAPATEAIARTKKTVPIRIAKILVANWVNCRNQALSEACAFHSPFSAVLSVAIFR
jgi:hypothetical protein